MTALHRFSTTFHALGSHNEITIYADPSSDADRLFSLVKNEVERIEKKYSRYQPDSILSKINNAAGESPVEIDTETSKLLDFADACFKQSSGLFDITSGVLRRAWNFKEARIPDSATLKETLALIGWRKVKHTSSSISLAKKGMEIDLGGFGKEYAVDQAITALQEVGVTSGYVNFGGDLRVIGLPPGRSAWIFGITHPRTAGAVAASLEIRSGALASSGDYERFFEHDGKRYCHILNPKSGMPVTDFQSISVAAPAATIAGSCTTIAMLLGYEKGVSFLKHMGFPYFIIDKNGTQFHEGFTLGTSPSM